MGPDGQVQVFTADDEKVVILDLFLSFITFFPQKSHVTWKSGYASLRYVTLRYVTLRYVTLRYVTLLIVLYVYVTLFCVTLLMIVYKEIDPISF